MADLIDRQATIDELDALCDRECEYSKKQRSVMCGACHLGSAFDVVEQLPSAQPEREIVRCADCKYFVLNSWENLGGVPIIVAHEICTKWGDGCKTSEDGYCFMAKRRTDE